MTIREAAIAAFCIAQPGLDAADVRGSINRAPHGPIGRKIKAIEAVIMQAVAAAMEDGDA